MAVYHARNAAVYISTSSSAEAVALTKATEWTLNMATDKVDTTAFGDANKSSVQGLGDRSGTFSGFWDDTSDTLYDAAASSDGVKMYLYPSTDAATKYWYGPAWVDMSVTASVTDAVKVSGTFSANGAWGQM